MKPSESKSIETIKLGDRDKARLVEAIDERSSAQQAPNDVERRNLRVSYNASGVRVTVCTAGAEVTFDVVPRNLSRMGMAFLHGRFVYPDTPCHVALPTQDGSGTFIDGRIRMCRHIGGIVHEVSVVFNEPIDLSLLVDMTPDEAKQHDQERSDDMSDEPGGDGLASRGQALIIDDYEADRRLATHWLCKIDMTAVETADADAAMTAIKSDTYDLILVDMNLGAGKSGAEVIKQIRTGGYCGSILAMSSTGDESVRKDAIASGANAFLDKPINPDGLKRQVQELLGADGGAPGDASPIISSMAEDHSMRPLLREFVSGLAGTVDRLRTARAANEVDSIREICSQLRGTGSGYGFEDVTRAAETVLAVIDESQDQVDDVRKKLNGLIETLRRIRFS